MLDKLRYGKLIDQRQLEQTKSMPVVCFKESLVEGTVSKENSKSMQSKELFACSSGLSTLQRGTLHSKKQNIHRV